MAGKKPSKANTKKDDPSVPGLAPPKNAAASAQDATKEGPGGGPRPASDAKTQYEERQQDEVTVLQAIYGDDFVQHKAAHSAWKTSEPSFDIRIKAPMDGDFAVTLGVVLTATYPKSVPVLTVKDAEGLREATLFKVHRFLEATARACAAEDREMIDTLVEGIREILDDAAAAKAQGLELPSLEEERAAHEATQARAAREEQARAEQQRQEATLEEERALGALVEQERERQRTKAKEMRRKNRSHNAGSGHVSPERVGLGGAGVDADAAASALVFDEPCDLTDAAGNAVYFRTVTGKFLLHTGPVARVYVVRPVLRSDQEPRSLALKQADLQAGAKDAVQAVKQVQALETALKALKKLRRQKVHRNLLDVLDFRIDRAETEGEQPATTTTTWTVSVLTLLADKGSLADVLELAGHLDVAKVRAWTRDLLDALDFLHGHALLHEDIHPHNVLLVRDASGDIVPKLADAAYQRLMHAMHARAAGPTVTSTRTARSAYWLPPEIAGASRPQYTQKTDVWDFGVVFLQMIFGLDAPHKYHSPRDLLDAHRLSDALFELVSRLFLPDPKKRPRAFDLGSSEFLATDAPILDDGFGLADEDGGGGGGSGGGARSGSLVSLPQLASRRGRRDSASRGAASSRYREDFIEEGRLGKGGFGEVVKARKKLDGQIYAIKKITITQSPQESLTVTDILKEVRLLSQLSHPAVVRYYNAWLEAVYDVGGGGSADSETVGGGSSQPTDAPDGFTVEFTRSGTGLDFLSSGGYPNIAFASDESDAEDAEDAEDDDGSDEDEGCGGDDSGDSDDSDDSDAASSQAAFSASDEIRDNQRLGATTPWKRMRRGSQRPGRTIMYISMEYCEKRSLRDLITRNLSRTMPEVWRLFRQLLEGLAHIHGLGIVHRDLKPENIFIGAGPDGVNNVKIGDFGLATTGQLGGGVGAERVLATGAAAAAAVDGMDETRSIGTAVYVAPEVRSGGSGSYTSKVDMYSLGVIFFEMCSPPTVGMQRADVLGKLRAAPPVLPADFRARDKDKDRAPVVDIIMALLTHNPRERPSGAELLKSGKLPVQMESETIRHALAELADPRSPYYQKMLSTLFARPVEQAKDYAWDLSAAQSQAPPSAQDLLRQLVVKETLVAVFRRHGAVEAAPRSSLYPRSALYGAANVVQLLDRNGNRLQLPFDLTMGNARALARGAVGSGGSGGSVGSGPVAKSYTFGSIFRDRPGGGQPSTFGEVDFDLVTAHTLDLALREAEVIKVVDEIAAALPAVRAGPLCFHLGHSDLLQLIFGFCGVEKAAARAVADVLSRLNVHGMTWHKLRAELRSPLVGASTTSIDELQKFDFRDTPTRAVARLKALFEGTDTFERASSTLAHLREVYEYGRRMGVASKMYVCPLHTWNEAFFAGGVMFSCLLDKKVKDVFAAGGRYDGLIKQYRPPRFGANPPADERHAVGFSLNWEKLAQAPPRHGGNRAFLKKTSADDDALFSAKRRCDVLVASFDPTILRSTGVELLCALWAHDISAELASDARSTEELVLKNRDEGYAWILIVKQERVVKIRTMPVAAAAAAAAGGSDAASAHKTAVPDVDVPLSQVVAWLRIELRERESAGDAGGAGVAAGPPAAWAAAA